MARFLGPCAIAALLAPAAVASAQGTAPAQSAGNPNQVSARVERAPLELTPPDRFRVPALVEPLRKVVVMAPADGVLRSLAVPVGSTVKEGQELGRLDASAAMARLKIAMASVKEMEANVGRFQGATSIDATVAAAHLDAARARAELAQMELDACTLRAPFSARVMAVDVSPGQYVAKGAAIIELADVSSVRVLLPVDRTAVSANGPVSFAIEGNPVSGRVQAILPLPERDAALRELAAPLAAAWVVVPNAAGSYEPGQRAQSPHLPEAPIAGVPNYAVRKDEAGHPIVQVIRAERVSDVPVKVIGALGADRSQVSGALRPSDVLIQSTTIPLRPGTFIRFSDATPSSTVEGLPPPASHVGEAAEVSSPAVAPIGTGRPAATPARRPATTAPKPAPAAPASGTVAPF